MHTLTLLRHAKSDQSAHVRDKDRPLNEKGFYDAPLMAKGLQEHGVIPDMMVSSYALRAETTAQIFAEVLGSEVKLDKALYNVDEASVIDIIRTTGEEVKDLMQTVGLKVAEEQIVRQQLFEAADDYLAKPIVDLGVVRTKMERLLNR